MNTLVVDPERLDALRSLQQPGTDNLLETVLTAYIDEARNLLADMQQAIESSDARRLRVAALALDSSSAGVGAMRVASLCRELDRAGEHGRLDRASPLFDRLTVALDETSSVLSEIASAEAA